MGKLLFPGIFHVTGEPDTGKTWFALHCGAEPKEIAFIDDDLKTLAIARQLEERGTPFALYENLTQAKDVKELDLNKHCETLIEKMTKIKPRVIIWDTWTRFQQTFRTVVQTNPLKFRNIYSSMGKIKGAEQNLAALMQESQTIARLGEIAEQVFLITHLKSAYKGGVPTGGERPAASNALQQKANFRLFLKHNPDGPAPIGLVLKRISKIADGTFGLVNVLPRKVVPCTWEKIAEYWANPIGDRQPTPEEMPDEYEIAILDDTLSPDEKMVMEAYIRRADIETDEETDDELREPDISARLTSVEECVKAADRLFADDPDSVASKKAFRERLKAEGFDLITIVKAEKEVMERAPF